MTLEGFFFYTKVIYRSDIRVNRMITFASSKTCIDFMEKNQIGRAFLLTLFIIIGLECLSFLPSLQYGEHTLRRVDLISDIRVRPDKKPKENIAISSSGDTETSLPHTKDATMPVTHDTTREDADSSVHRMKHFYEAVIHREALQRPVRIAYFGDSFIEGDILVGDLRALLQKQYGGRGVGYVPITSEAPGFRTTVHHRFAGWHTHVVTDKKGFIHRYQDISNRYFVPDSTAWVQLSGTKRFAPTLESCQRSSLFIYTGGGAHVTARINGGETQHFDVAGDSTLRRLDVTGSIASVKWSINHSTPGVRCYAVAMEDSTGIVVDNFSLRGSSGQLLQSIPQHVFDTYRTLRPYDLIVLHYGANIASNKISDYSYYTHAMKKVIKKLQTAFPETSILLVGASDRAYKDEDGVMQTMPAIHHLIHYQQKLARETGVAFWNLFEAMGGEGSMVRMVEEKPAKANLDYTHINARGGAFIAQKLYEEWMRGIELYKKQKE